MSPTLEGWSYRLVLKRNNKRYSTKGWLQTQIPFCLFFNELHVILGLLLFTEILTISMKLLTVFALLCAMIALTSAASEYWSTIKNVYMSVIIHTNDSIIIINGNSTNKVYKVLLSPTVPDEGGKDGSEPNPPGWWPLNSTCPRYLPQILLFKWFVLIVRRETISKETIFKKHGIPIRLQHFCWYIPQNHSFLLSIRCLSSGEHLVEKRSRCFHRNWGWTRYGDRYFRFFPQQWTWAEAQVRTVSFI